VRFCPATGRVLTALPPGSLSVFPLLFFSSRRPALAALAAQHARPAFPLAADAVLREHEVGRAPAHRLGGGRVRDMWGCVMGEERGLEGLLCMTKKKAEEEMVKVSPSEAGGREGAGVR
jgi:hypothetical protein